MERNRNETKERRKIPIRVVYRWVEGKDEQGKRERKLVEVDFKLPTIQFYLNCPYRVRITTHWTIPKGVDSDPVKWWFERAVRRAFGDISLIPTLLGFAFKDVVYDFEYPSLTISSVDPLWHVHVTEGPYIEGEEVNGSDENNTYETVVLAFLVEGKVLTSPIGVERLPKLLESFSYPFNDLVVEIGKSFQKSLQKSLPSYLVKITEELKEWREKYGERGVRFSVSEVEVTVDTTQRVGTGAGYTFVDDLLATRKLTLSFPFPIPFPEDVFAKTERVTSPRVLRSLATVYFLARGDRIREQRTLLWLADLLESGGRVELSDLMFTVEIIETHEIVTSGEV